MLVLSKPGGVRYLWQNYRRSSEGLKAKCWRTCWLAFKMADSSCVDLECSSMSFPENPRVL